MIEYDQRVLSLSELLATLEEIDSELPAVSLPLRPCLLHLQSADSSRAQACMHALLISACHSVVSSAQHLFLLSPHYNGPMRMAVLMPEDLSACLMLHDLPLFFLPGMSLCVGCVTGQGPDTAHQDCAPAYCLQRQVDA
jgi:hypothetical protein